MAKKLGPPRGAAETADAAHRLHQRFTNSPEPEPAAPPPAATTRAVADGMTRRTYYLPTETAEKLGQAIADLEAATGGLVPRHRILAAIITTGTADIEHIRVELREELMDNLDTSYPGTTQE